MMMSMSGGWFFVVAAEAISVGDTSIRLPGIGSFIALAIERRDLDAVGWAIAAMFVVILIYDQLLFRPLVAWVDRFRVEQDVSGARPKAWVLDTLRRSALVAALVRPLSAIRRESYRMSVRVGRLEGTKRRNRRWIEGAWMASVALAVAFALWHLGRFVSTEVSLADVVDAVLRGFATMLRILVLLAIASLVWVPIGVWVGMRPPVARAVQPLAQFLAAFPANLVFPFAVSVIATLRLDPDIWLSPLMILGTQWYILFNVVAGGAAIPSELRDAGTNFGIAGWLWWRRIALPAVFPYYVTGAITASGGSWNASIVAEVASWGDRRFEAYGLGAQIARATETGDFPRIVVGIVVMSLFVVVINRAVWRPLYRYAERRFRSG
jgi:NitT/TauT family transport system permease protein